MSEDTPRLGIVTPEGTNVFVVLPKHANWALCLTCGRLIESKFRHDWQACACKDEATRIFVDGGQAYSRFGCGPQAKWCDVDGEHRA